MWRLIVIGWIIFIPALYTDCAPVDMRTVDTCPVVIASAKETQ